MTDEINYKNNPLHGVSLKKVLTEIVNHYGFKILYAYLNINCFKANPSIDSSVKFLKKTDWAREKVEAFYLYQYKNLPRASDDQFELAPRDRIVPEGQVPGDPAELSLEDAERLREKRAKKQAERLKDNQKGKGRAGRHKDKKTAPEEHGWDFLKQEMPAKHRIDRQLCKPKSKPPQTALDPWAKSKKSK